MLQQAEPASEDLEAIHRQAKAPCGLPVVLNMEAAATQTVCLNRQHRGPWLQLRNPARTEWNHATVRVPGLPGRLKGLRIAHLTDLHMRPSWMRGHDHMLELLGAHRPDLILFTGDFVNDKRDPRAALPMLERFLAGMEAPLGIFGITGNHDGPWLPPLLTGMNMRLIDGRRLVMERGDAALELIGLPGPFRSSLTQPFMDSLPAPEPGVPRVILSHYPDHLLRVAHLRADLFLAGHTHGGQCCLPGRIPILRHDRMPRRFCTGLHTIDPRERADGGGDERKAGGGVGPTWLSVSRGLGFSGPPVRVFCPTEIVELELSD